MPEGGELAFSLYEFRKLLRWSDDSGGAYREIRDALARIQLTGVQSTNAYYSAADEGVDGLMVSFRTMFDPEARYEVVLGGQAFGIEVKDRSIRVYRAAPADPGVRIETDVETLGALVYEGGDLDEALRSGDVEIGGDRSAVERLLGLFPLPEPAPKPASSTVASSRSSTAR